MELTLLEAWSLYWLLNKFSENLVWDRDIQEYTDYYPDWVITVSKSQYLAIGRIVKKLTFQSWMTFIERYWVEDFLDRLIENLYYDSVTKFYHEDADNWVICLSRKGYLAIKRVLKKWRKRFSPAVLKWLHQKENE